MPKPEGYRKALRGSGYHQSDHLEQSAGRQYEVAGDDLQSDAVEESDRLKKSPKPRPELSARPTITVVTNWLTRLTT
jgi:hypothetical protein